MSRKVIGIDIQNDALTAVLLNSSLREYRVDDFMRVPFAGSDDPDRSLSSALETLTERMDISGGDFVVSVPASQFIFRNLKVPFHKPNKIRMVLPFELEPTLPSAVQDLVIDFQTLLGVSTDDQTDLFAAAIEKNQLTPYIEALASVNIDPEKLTISGLPTALCLAHQPDIPEDLLYLEIEDAYATVFVIVDEDLQLIRSFPLPAAGPTKMSLLCTQIQQTLAAFQESSQWDFQPAEIMASGIGLGEAGMVAEISNFLKIPVKVASVAERLDIAVEREVDSLWIPAQMDNALALALMEVEGYQGLNFHKGQFAAQKLIAKHKGPLLKTGILAAAVLVLMFFNLIMKTYTLNKQIRGVDNQMAQIFKETFPNVQSVRYPYQEMQAKIREAKTDVVFTGETGPHVRSIDIINSISQKIPASIKVNLTRLVIQPENVLISGTTDTYDAVDTIKSGLEQVQLFEKVTIGSANIDRAGNEVRFMLKVEL